MKTENKQIPTSPLYAYGEKFKKLFIYFIFGVFYVIVTSVGILFASIHQKRIEKKNVCISECKAKERELRENKAVKRTASTLCLYVVQEKHFFMDIFAKIWKKCLIL